MADDKALLVAFAEWYGQAYAANFIPKGTIDAFLSTRQPPGEPVITLGCEHGRLPGHPCPHCMGINEPVEPQRFWRVQNFGGESSMDPFCYQAYTVDVRGGWLRPLDGAACRPTRELAEADGEKSGLPGWKP